MKIKDTAAPVRRIEIDGLTISEDGSIKLEIGPAQGRGILFCFADSYAVATDASQPEEVRQRARCVIRETILRGIWSICSTSYGLNRDNIEDPGNFFGTHEAAGDLLTVQRDLIGAAEDDKYPPEEEVRALVAFNLQVEKPAEYNARLLECIKNRSIVTDALTRRFDLAEMLQRADENSAEVIGQLKKEEEEERQQHKDGGPPQFILDLIKAAEKAGATIHPVIIKHEIGGGEGQTKFVRERPTDFLS
jgi:hypothetical protein